MAYTVPVTPLHLRLRELRKAAGLTQEQLATAAGVRQGTVSALETRKSKGIDFATAEALAKALGVDPHELFETTPAKRRPLR